MQDLFQLAMQQHMAQANQPKNSTGNMLLKLGTSLGGYQGGDTGSFAQTAGVDPMTGLQGMPVAEAAQQANIANFMGGTAQQPYGLQSMFKGLGGY